MIDKIANTFVGLVKQGICTLQGPYITVQVEVDLLR